MQADGCIIVNGENIPVELYLGGDYKVHVSTLKRQKMTANLVVANKKHKLYNFST